MVKDKSYFKLYDFAKNFHYFPSIDFLSFPAFPRHYHNQIYLVCDHYCPANGRQKVTIASQ